MLLYALFRYEAQGEKANPFVAGKIAWFLQAMGQDMKLNFLPHFFGPYSNSMAPLLYSLKGRYIKTFSFGETKAFEPLGLNYDKFEELRNFLNTKINKFEYARLRNLISLISGFESPAGLGLLASVDYLSLKENAISAEDVYDKLQSWSGQKAGMFKLPHVEAAWERLEKYKPLLRTAE